MSFWTEERIDRLSDLWDRGYSAALIGGFLGTTKNAVISKSRSLELPEREVLYTQTPRKPKTRSKGFQIRRSTPKPPAPPRHSNDFSWHLAQVAAGANFRDIATPEGAPSWRTFTRKRASDPDMQAAYEQARMARNLQPEPLKQAA